MGPLDLDFVRSQFPALAGGWAFFDNAGGSQTLGRVGSLISEYLYGSMVAHGAPYEQSVLGARRLGSAAERFADLVHAADPSEIIMGSSSTQLEQNLGMAMSTWLQPGDEIILSRVEHHANVEPWDRLAQRGVILKHWEVNRESWNLEPEDLEKLWSTRTRLVAFTHCSNVLGTIQDVPALTRLIHAHGAQVLVDGVAFASHRCVDVQAWDVDYYLLSTYKIYGPHHAVLYGKRDHLLGLHGINHSFLPEDMIPYKFQPGNANCELSHGATAVVDYLEELGLRAGAAATAPAHQKIAAAFEAIAQHEELLAERLLTWLKNKPKLRLLGSPSHARTVRVPTLSFVVEGIDSRTIPERLAQHRIGVRSGDFYARALAEDFDLGKHGGAIRVSMVHYNTLEEVDRLIEHLDEIV